MKWDENVNDIDPNIMNWINNSFILSITETVVKLWVWVDWANFLLVVVAVGKLQLLDSTNLQLCFQKSRVEKVQVD